jgi:hypothetical protein
MKQRLRAACIKALGYSVDVALTISAKHVRAADCNCIGRIGVHATHAESAWLFCHQIAHTLSKCSHVTMDIIDMNCCTGGEPGDGGGKCNTGAGDARMPVRPSDIGMTTLRLRAAPICKHITRHQQACSGRVVPMVGTHQCSRCHVDGAANAVEALRKEYSAAGGGGSINRGLNGVCVIAVAVACSSSQSHTMLAGICGKRAFSAVLLSVEHPFHVECWKRHFVPLVLRNNLR